MQRYARVLPLLLFLAGSAFAQSVLTLGSATGAPGSTVLLDLTFNSSLSTVTGLQWTLNYSPADIATIEVVAGPAATASSQFLTCANQAGAVRCLLVSLTAKTLSSGVVAVVKLQFALGTRNGASAISLTDALGASKDGSALPIETHGSVIPITGSALRFRPMTPCRIADSRVGNPFGGPGFPANSSKDFAVLASACAIPSTAAAYSLNVSVLPAGKLGYLTVWPTGQPQPLVATLNSLDGRAKSNAVIVAAGAHGTVSAYATDATDVLIDINGYFTPATDTAALPFYPLAPCRIADTRNPPGLLGGPGLAPDHARVFPVRQSGCAVPADAQAYSLNVAVVPKGPLQHLTAWAAGQPQPPLATLSAPTGAITANALIVPAGSNGDVAMVATGDTDVVIDINGYFAPAKPGGLSLYNLAPCRVLDTRLPAGAEPFNGTRDLVVAESGCAVLPAAKAYVFNATVVPPGSLGYITLWPQGAPQPVVATLNAVDGTITNNIALVPTTNGSVSAFASGPTHLVIDVFGFFAP